MAGQPTKKGSWGDWAIIELRPNKSRIACSFCKFYCSDGSCSIHPIVISDVGYNYWKHCDHFLLNSERDTPEFREKVNLIKGYNSPYQPYNTDLLRKLQNGNKSTKVSTTPIKAKQKPQQSTFESDCRYSKYVPASKCFICSYDESMHWTQNCIRCEYYEREVIIIGNIRMSHAEYEKKIAANAVPTSFARPSTKKKSTSTAKKDKKNTSTTSASQQKKNSTPSAKFEQLKSHPDTLKKAVEVKVAANPKLGCKYLSGSTCILQNSCCTRGTQNCLFYKTD